MLQEFIASVGQQKFPDAEYCWLMMWLQPVQHLNPAPERFMKRELLPSV
jgi:hypothetical protein